MASNCDLLLHRSALLKPVQLPLWDLRDMIFCEFYDRGFITSSFISCTHTSSLLLTLWEANISTTKSAATPANNSGQSLLPIFTSRLLFYFNCSRQYLQKYPKLHVLTAIIQRPLDYIITSLILPLASPCPGFLILRPFSATKTLSYLALCPVHKFEGLFQNLKAIASRHLGWSKGIISHLILFVCPSKLYFGEIQLKEYRVLLSTSNKALQ